MYYINQGYPEKQNQQCKEIKEVAHAVMKAEKAPNLQLVIWRRKKADDIVLV